MTLYLFAHLHKCAGSSVVSAAVDAGYNLPANHRNGNPPNKDGRAMAGFAKMDKDRLRSFFEDQLSAGVTFLAMEWDFPLLSRLPRDLDIRPFTVLRDPIDRIVSNYRMDAALDYGAPVVGIRQYMDGRAMFRSHNYFCRFFSGPNHKDEPTSETLDFALRTLQQVHYEFADRDLQSFLSSIGMNVEDVPHRNRTRKGRYRGGLAMDVSASDEAWLARENSLDIALYRQLRRMASSPSG